MNRQLAALTLALTLLVPSIAMSTPMNNQDILNAADESRGNIKGISWQVHVESVEGKYTDSMTYEIKARGFDVAGINLEPPKLKGNKLLMLDRNMWFHKPGLSKPVPISQRQRLMGNASYGDIAATNYASDYAPTRLKDEIIDGIDCYVFDLESEAKNTTYDRIKYWVAKDQLIGIKAEYYTLSGKRIKSARMDYENTVTIDGVKRPFISKISIFQELVGTDVTTLTLTRPQLAELPDYVFNLNLFMQ